MKFFQKELEHIASTFLEQNANARGDEAKPNYSNRDFMNALIIFQNALMDKMYDLMEVEGIEKENREDMAESCGLALRNLIHTYTGLDTHDFQKFI